MAEKQMTRQDIQNIIQETLAIYDFNLRTKKPPQFLFAKSVPAGGTTGQGMLIGKIKNLGIFYGSGAPTLSAAQGSLYLRTDGSSTSTRLYVNSNGSTSWVAITTAS